MKKPVFNLEQISQIEKSYPTPFHIYDEKGIRDNARRLNAAFAWNPGFREYFAVKALPNPSIMQIFKEEHCGVDCSSLTELMLAERTGFSGDEIMFSSNVTPAEEFIKARTLDAIINLDDISHIDFLAEHGGIPEKICLRFNPGGDFSIGNAVMGTPRDSKYGMTRGQITKSVKRLMLLGVKSFGLHAFLASNTTDQGYYAVLSGILFQMAVELTRETGAKIEFVNLSGGIGIPYFPEQKEANIEVIGERVHESYKNTVEKAGLSLSIYAELGRYMTGPYGYLVTKCIHKKHIYKDYVGVDACSCNLMRPAMYGAYHHISVLGKEDEAVTNIYDVTGSLCENNDKFAIDRPLPHIDIGDIIAIHDTGAHGSAMGYNYNGKMHCAELLLKADGTVAQIRRAQTPEDYFGTVVF